MNDPIISPWLIYFIGISEQITNTCSAIAITTAVLVGCTIVVFSMLALLSDGDLNMFKKIKTWHFVSLLTVVFGCTAVSTLIPEPKYIVAIAISNEVTPQSLQTTSEAVINFKNEFKNDIIDILESIDDAKDESQ
jgi:hypothetical protein